MSQDNSTRPGGCGAAGVLLAALALLVVCAAPAAARQRAVVAAASDLNAALAEMVSRFPARRSERVEIVLGSSGLLARQIRDGAPFDLFLSADESYVDRLADAGLTRGRGTLYAVGRIVLFAPAGSPFDPADGFAGLARLIQAGKVSRFAIANPEHAPYGRAAEAALRKHGLWDGLRPRLVLGENVSQAAQFATTANAAGGVIAYSLALAPALRERGAYALIPEGDHPPLRQRMVLLRRAGPLAERFYDYLQGPDARRTLQRYGFALPD